MAYVSKLPSGKFRARGRHPVTRKLVTFGKPYDTETAALVAATRGELELRREVLDSFRGEHPAVTTVTFADHGSRWLAQVDGVRSTKDGYASQLRSLNREGWAERDLASITAEDVSVYLVRLRDERKSESTRRGRFTTLRMILRHAVAVGILPTDPTAGIKKPVEVQRTVREVTMVELAAVVERMPAYRHAFFYLMREAGLRYAEAAALRLEDVVGGTILVARVLERDGTMRPWTKSGRVRIVPILPETELRLREHYAAHGRADGLMFVNEDGNQLTYRSTARVWSRAWAAAKLGGTDATMHHLRHSFAHEYADSGTAARNVRDMLGHADLKTTERYMGRANVDDARRWLAVARGHAV